ncbi:MAG: hypothetical protein ABH875_00105 [Candidatus Omnitrophota bacterium]
MERDLPAILSFIETHRDQEGWSEDLYTWLKQRIEARQADVGATSTATSPKASEDPKVSIVDETAKKTSLTDALSYRRWRGAGSWILSLLISALVLVAGIVTMNSTHVRVAEQTIITLTGGFSLDTDGPDDEDLLAGRQETGVFVISETRKPIKPEDSPDPEDELEPIETEPVPDAADDGVDEPTEATVAGAGTDDRTETSKRGLYPNVVTTYFGLIDANGRRVGGHSIGVRHGDIMYPRDDFESRFIGDGRVMLILKVAADGMTILNCEVDRARTHATEAMVQASLDSMPDRWSVRLTPSPWSTTRMELLIEFRKTSRAYQRAGYVEGKGLPVSLSSTSTAAESTDIPSDLMVDRRAVNRILDENKIAPLEADETGTTHSIDEWNIAVTKSTTLRELVADVASDVAERVNRRVTGTGVRLDAEDLEGAIFLILGSEGSARHKDARRLLRRLRESGSLKLYSFGVDARDDFFGDHQGYGEAGINIDALTALTLERGSQSASYAVATGLFGHQLLGHEANESLNEEHLSRRDLNNIKALAGGDEAVTQDIMGSIASVLRSDSMILNAQRFGKIRTRLAREERRLDLREENEAVLREYGVDPAKVSEKYLTIPSGRLRARIENLREQGLIPDGLAQSGRMSLLYYRIETLNAKIENLKASGAEDIAKLTVTQIAKADTVIEEVKAADEAGIAQESAPQVETVAEKTVVSEPETVASPIREQVVEQPSLDTASLEDAWDVLKYRIRRLVKAHKRRHRWPIGVGDIAGMIAQLSEGTSIEISVSREEIGAAMALSDRMKSNEPDVYAVFLTITRYFKKQGYDIGRITQLTRQLAGMDEKARTFTRGMANRLRKLTAWAAMKSPGMAAACAKAGTVIAAAAFFILLSRLERDSIVQSLPVIDIWGLALISCVTVITGFALSERARQYAERDTVLHELSLARARGYRVSISEAVRTSWPVLWRRVLIALATIGPYLASIGLFSLVGTAIFQNNSMLSGFLIGSASLGILGLLSAIAVMALSEKGAQDKATSPKWFDRSQLNGLLAAISICVLLASVEMAPITVVVSIVAIGSSVAIAQFLSKQKDTTQWLKPLTITTGMALGLLPAGTMLLATRVTYGPVFNLAEGALGLTQGANIILVIASILVVVVGFIAILAIMPRAKMARAAWTFLLTGLLLGFAPASMAIQDKYGIGKDLAKVAALVGGEEIVAPPKAPVEIEADKPAAAAVEAEPDAADATVAAEAEEVEEAEEEEESIENQLLRRKYDNIVRRLKQLSADAENYREGLRYAQLRAFRSMQASERGTEELLPRELWQAKVSTTLTENGQAFDPNYTDEDVKWGKYADRSWRDILWARNYAKNWNSSKPEGLYTGDRFTPGYPTREDASIFLSTWDGVMVRDADMRPIKFGSLDELPEDVRAGLEESDIYRDPVTGFYVMRHYDYIITDDKLELIGGAWWGRADVKTSVAPLNTFPYDLKARDPILFGQLWTFGEEHYTSVNVMPITAEEFFTRWRMGDSHVTVDPKTNICYEVSRGYDPLLYASGERRLLVPDANGLFLGTTTNVNMSAALYRLHENGRVFSGTGALYPFTLIPDDRTPAWLVEAGYTDTRKYIKAEEMEMLIQLGGAIVPRTKEWLMAVGKDPLLEDMYLYGEVPVRYRAPLILIGKKYHDVLNNARDTRIAELNRDGRQREAKRVGREEWWIDDNGHQFGIYRPLGQISSRIRMAVEAYEDALKMVAELEERLGIPEEESVLKDLQIKKEGSEEGIFKVEPPDDFAAKPVKAEGPAAAPLTDRGQILREVFGITEAIPDKVADTLFFYIPGRMTEHSGVIKAKVKGAHWVLGTGIAVKKEGVTDYLLETKLLPGKNTIILTARTALLEEYEVEIEVTADVEVVRYKDIDIVITGDDARAIDRDLILSVADAMDVINRGFSGSIERFDSLQILSDEGTHFDVSDPSTLILGTIAFKHGPTAALAAAWHESAHKIHMRHPAISDRQKDKLKELFEDAKRLGVTTVFDESEYLEGVPDGWGHPHSDDLELFASVATTLTFFNDDLTAAIDKLGEEEKKVALEIVELVRSCYKSCNEGGTRIDGGIGGLFQSESEAERAESDVPAEAEPTDSIMKRALESVKIRETKDEEAKRFWSAYMQCEHAHEVTMQSANSEYRYMGGAQGTALGEILRRQEKLKMGRDKMWVAQYGGRIDPRWPGYMERSRVRIAAIEGLGAVSWRDQTGKLWSRPLVASDAQYMRNTVSGGYIINVPDEHGVMKTRDVEFGLRSSQMRSTMLREFLRVRAEEVKAEEVRKENIDAIKWSKDAPPASTATSQDIPDIKIKAVVAQGEVTLVYESDSDARPLSPEEAGMLTRSVEHWLGQFGLLARLDIKNKDKYETLPIEIPLVIISNRENIPSENAIVLETEVLSKLCELSSEEARLYLNGVIFEKGYMFLNPEYSEAMAEGMTVEYIRVDPARLDATIQVLSADNGIDDTEEWLTILKRVQAGSLQEFTRSVPLDKASVSIEPAREWNDRMRLDHQRKVIQIRDEQDNLIERPPGMFTEFPSTEELVKPIRERSQGKHFIAIPYGNLFMNGHFVVFTDGATFHNPAEFGEDGIARYDDGEERVYSCFVARMDGSQSIEKLKFRKGIDGQRDAIYLAADLECKNDISKEIETAFYGHPIIENGDVRSVSTFEREIDDKNQLTLPYPHALIATTTDGRLIVDIIGGSRADEIGVSIEEAQNHVRALRAGGELIEIENAILISSGGDINVIEDDKLVTQAPAGAKGREYLRAPFISGVVGITYEGEPTPVESTAASSTATDTQPLSQHEVSQAFTTDQNGPTILIGTGERGLSDTMQLELEKSIDGKVKFVPIDGPASEAQATMQAKVDEEGADLGIILDTDTMTTIDIPTIKSKIRHLLRSIGSDIIDPDLRDRESLEELSTVIRDVVKALDQERDTQYIRNIVHDANLSTEALGELLVYVRGLLDTITPIDWQNITIEGITVAPSTLFENMSESMRIHGLPKLKENKEGNTLVVTEEGDLDQYLKTLDRAMQENLGISLYALYEKKNIITLDQILAQEEEGTATEKTTSYIRKNLFGGKDEISPTYIGGPRYYQEAINIAMIIRGLLRNQPQAIEAALRLLGEKAKGIDTEALRRKVLDLRPTQDLINYRRAIEETKQAL